MTVTAMSTAFIETMWAAWTFGVDENGLWIIYRNGTRRNIFVSKLNVDDLSIQKTVIIGLNNKRAFAMAMAKHRSKRFNDNPLIEFENTFGPTAVWFWTAKAIGRLLVQSGAR